MAVPFLSWTAFGTSAFPMFLFLNMERIWRYLILFFSHQYNKVNRGLSQSLNTLRETPVTNLVKRRILDLLWPL